MLTTIQPGTNLDEVWKLSAEQTEWFWPQLANLLQRYPDDLFLYYDLQSLKDMLEAGELEAWVGLAKDSKNVELAALLSFETYPLRKQYRFFWIGGKGWKRFMPGSLKKIEKYAYACGAEQVVFQGRPGWIRRLNRFHYYEQKIYMEKNLIRERGH